MYDNFSTREYALIDAYLANTLQPNERTELNKTLQTNKSLYEYIVLRKQLQYIGDQKQLVNAALLVQTNLGTPLYEDIPAIKPKFWLQKSFYAVGAAASLLFCICFLVFYNKNTNLFVKNEPNKTKNNLIYNNNNVLNNNENSIHNNNNVLNKNENSIHNNNNVLNKNENSIHNNNNVFNKNENSIHNNNNVFNKNENSIHNNNNVFNKNENSIYNNNNVFNKNENSIYNNNNVLSNNDNLIHNNNNVLNNNDNLINNNNNIFNNNNIKKPIKSAENNIYSYFKKHFPKEINGIVFSFDTTNDTLFTTERGTIIAIPKNVFATNDKNLSITVKEAYTYKDMFLHQLNTFADNSELMETGGMLFLEVKDSKGQKLALKPNQKIRVQMPSNSLKTDMQLFNQNEMDTASVRNASAWNVASGTALQTSFVERNSKSIILNKPKKKKFEQDEKDYYYENARINRIGEVYGVVDKVKKQAWGSGFEYDCAVCSEVYKNRFNIFYNFDKNIYNLKGSFDKKSCKKYNKNLIKMNREVDSLKQLYKIKTTKGLISRMRRDRRDKIKDETTKQYEAYKRKYQFKSDNEFKHIVTLKELCNEKGDITTWLMFLRKYYKVSDRAALNQKIRWEVLYKDSLDIEDEMRFLDTKDRAKAKKVLADRLQNEALTKQLNPILFGGVDNAAFISDPTRTKGNVVLDSATLAQANTIKKANMALAEITKFGWVNIDRFMGMPNLIALKPSNPENATIIAVFKNYKCCLGISDNMNPYASSKGAPRVPRNQPITLVAYKMKDGELMLSATHTTTSNATEIQPLKPILPVELDKMIAGL